MLVSDLNLQNKTLSRYFILSVQCQQLLSWVVQNDFQHLILLVAKQRLDMNKFKAQRPKMRTSQMFAFSKEIVNELPNIMLGTRKEVWKQLLWQRRTNWGRNKQKTIKKDAPQDIQQTFKEELEINEIFEESRTTPWENPKSLKNENEQARHIVKQKEDSINKETRQRNEPKWQTREQTHYKKLKNQRPQSVSHLAGGSTHQAVEGMCWPTCKTTIFRAETSKEDGESTRLKPTH